MEGLVIFRGELHNKYGEFHTECIKFDFQFQGINVDVLYRAKVSLRLFPMFLPVTD